MNYLKQSMKTFSIILALILTSCSVHIEDQMIITKKYAGRVQYSYNVANFTQVVTDRAAFKVCGIVDIPDSVHCYIRTVPVYVDVHPGIADRLQRKYFSFDSLEYRIKTW